ncbi:MAG: sensor domain-containing diguanylate cyclase, partial [Oxalobacteraceae bacterium]
PARGRLKCRTVAFRWLFEPSGDVSPEGRTFLLGQLLSSLMSAIMGSLCALVVLVASFLRSAQPVFGLLIGFEVLLITWRFADRRRRRRLSEIDPEHVPPVDASVLISLLWCTLQGISAFTIMSGDDPVMRVLSSTLVMAMIGPICARNYAAPRFAFLLILLCDLPFVIGAAASHERWLIIIVPITPPFLLGAMQIIGSFHRTMLLMLAAQERNLHLAEHDSLTGILNRQGMDAALGQVWPDASRKMALVSIDLDGFKQVNDRHGHSAGDLVLVEVAKRIRTALSDEHLLGRMGGDEFMVIKRDVSPADVGPFVEELITSISNQPYELSDGTTARVGASIGFACLPEDASSAVELRMRADQALYQAKRAGRGVGLRYGERPDCDDRASTVA